MTAPGRIVDNICFLGSGLQGADHRECAMGCDRAGVRMALLDEKANLAVKEVLAGKGRE